MVWTASWNRSVLRRLLLAFGRMRVAFLGSYFLSYCESILVVSDQVETKL